MKLLIDIPDDVYEDIEHGKGDFINTLNWAVRNGTPVSNEGDLISRSELKKAFYNQECWNCVIEHIIDNAPTVEPENEYNIGFYDGFMSAKENIEKEPERPQGEWILVSERLPEENVCDDGYHEPSKWVLVQARNGHMYTTRYWTRDKKNVWTDLDYPDDIVAWQPLPERYRKEGEEE